MRLRRQTTISREGLYYLVVVALVFGGALMGEVNLLLILAGMLTGPLLLSRFLAVLSLRDLSVRRKVPHGICAGDLLVAGVTVTNQRRSLSSWAVVVDESLRRESAQPQGRRGRPVDPCVFFPHVPAGQSRRAVYRGRLTERGRYRLGPLRMSTRYPFGLFRYTLTLGQAATLTVYPRIGRLTRDWIARRHKSFAGTDRRENRPGVEGDFYGVRPWREGDSRRWIHWRTSARTGKLAVRQFEQPRNRDVAILLDLWQSAEPSQEQKENVELAVSFAATVIADLCRKGGSDVYLATAAPAVDLAGGPASAALLQDLLDRLATVEGHALDCTEELLEQAAARIEQGTEIIVVTTRPVDLADRARFERLWADTARRSVLRHARVVDASSPELTKYFQPE